MQVSAQSNLYPSGRKVGSELSQVLRPNYVFLLLSLQTPLQDSAIHFSVLSCSCYVKCCIWCLLAAVRIRVCYSAVQNICLIFLVLITLNTEMTGMILDCFSRILGFWHRWLNCSSGVMFVLLSCNKDTSCYVFLLWYKWRIKVDAYSRCRRKI